MDNNIVINSRTFGFRSSSEKNGNYRVDASSGINTPTTLNVKQARYADTDTKLAGHMTAVRFEMPVSIQNGLKLQNVSATLTVRVPVDTSVDYDTHVEPLVDLMKALLNSTTLPEDLFNNRSL